MIQDVPFDHLVGKNPSGTVLYADSQGVVGNLRLCDVVAYRGTRISDFEELDRRRVRRQVLQEVKILGQIIRRSIGLLLTQMSRIERRLFDLGEIVCRIAVQSNLAKFAYCSSISVPSHFAWKCCNSLPLTKGELVPWPSLR